MRGLIDFRGRAWLTLTPISEPWLFDEIVGKADGKKVWFTTGDIRDNPYLSEEAIQDFESKLLPEEIEARIHGKFIHLAITLNQKSMDVYINGMIYQHLTLAALPLQNTESLYIADNGGWSGMIGDFTYYNYMLTPGEVHNLSLKKPRRDPNDLPYYPDYLDTSWWMGRA
jgi:hypothetical protein